jgi:cytochrome c5
MNPILIFVIVLLGSVAFPCHAQATAPRQPQSTTPGQGEGESVYQTVCIACHAPANVMVSSPKAGDVAEWNRRLKKGMPVLIDNAINGVGAMPAKGGASALTRTEIGLAIEFMSKP